MALPFDASGPVSGMLKPILTLSAALTPEPAAPPVATRTITAAARKGFCIARHNRLRMLRHSLRSTELITNGAYLGHEGCTVVDDDHSVVPLELGNCLPKIPPRSKRMPHSSLATKTKGRRPREIECDSVVTYTVHASCASPFSIQPA